MQTRQETSVNQDIPPYPCELTTTINGEIRTLHLLVSAALMQKMCQSTTDLLLTSPIENDHHIVYKAKLKITLPDQLKYNDWAYITVDYFHELELDITFFPTEPPILTTARALSATPSLSIKSGSAPSQVAPLATSTSSCFFQPSASRPPKQSQHPPQAAPKKSTRTYKETPSYKSFLTPNLLATPTFITFHHDNSRIHITFNLDILKEEFRGPIRSLNHHINKFAENGLFNNCDRQIGSGKIILSFSKEFSSHLITQSVLEFICTLRAIPARSIRICYSKEAVAQATRTDEDKNIIHTLLKAKIEPLCPAVPAATWMDFLKCKLTFPGVPGLPNEQQRAFKPPF